MKIKDVTLQEGCYTCDIDISVDEWKNILKDTSLTTENYKEKLLMFYHTPKYKSTCKELAIKYKIHPQSINSTITRFAEAVQKRLNSFEIIGVDGNASFWIILMQGRHIKISGRKYFEWTLRPELVDAIKELSKEDNSFL